MTRSISLISKFKFLLFVIFFSSCTHVSKIDSVKIGSPVEVSAQRTLLIGKWYSEIPTREGMTRKSLIERRIDGTYTVKFQLFKGVVKTLDQIEAGIWGISGNIYFTATREILASEEFVSVDTTDPTYYDGYLILKLQTNLFSYKSLDGGNVFEVHKVPNTFMLQ